MSDTEKSNRTMEGELKYLRKRVGELEAEVQVLRQFKPPAKEDPDWFRKLIGIMNEAFLILDKDANITYCNERLLEFLGRREDEVLGRSASEFIDSDSLEHFGEQFLMRSDGKRGFYEMNIKDRDGQKNPVLCSASPIFNDQGEFQGSISTLTDMRFLKKAQETIKLERDKFQLLADVSPFGLVLVARDGSFEYMNPKFIETFGYDYEDVPDGKTWRLKVFPDENYRREMLNAWVEDLKKAKPGDVRPRVYTLRCKDGTDKIAHFRPVRLSTGQDLMTCEDITDFTKSEIARKKAYSILGSALESTADGILVIDRDGHVSAYNRKFLQIWRIPQEMAPSFHDKGLLESVIDRIADPDTFREKVNYLYEHPGEEASDIIEFADGRIIERYTKPQVIGDQIVGRVWSFRDVTVRIELEKELGQAIAELKLANRETRALLNCARTILESDNFRHAAQFILDSAMELTSAEAGNITFM
ncbi:MAG: PAS domain S-box protein, partial [Desulfomonilaceae bacterium]